ncbi:MAG: leucine-rich repeat domain-containing protein [Salinivirgaceae bacterium]|nr:leucine-rich repeat domain-containing protein [Salinivirgaceae bacterium]
MKRIFITLSFIVLIVANALAQTFTVDGLNYTIIDGTTNVSVAKGSTELTGELSIPITVENDGIIYNVTNIVADAFKDCGNLITVIVPNSVTNIGLGAFSGCSSLVSISLPFVGDKAQSATDNSQQPLGHIFGTNTYFGGTATQQYYRPSSGGVFYPTNYYIPTTLKTVIITGSNYLPHRAFYNCNGLTSIGIPNSVTYIGDYAFEKCEHLNIYCAMEIGSKPAGWNNSRISSNCCVFWGSKFDGDFAYRVTNNELYEAEIIGYLGNDSIVEIPNEIAINVYTKCKVTSISANAFHYHTNMTKIIISNTVKSIGNSAFYECTGLSAANIGYSVENIGSDAFNGCTGLTSIVLPISLTTIGDGAFTNCYNIESMNIKCLTPPTINSQTFLSVDKNIPVFVTCGNAKVYKSTDYWKDFVTFIDNEIPYTIEAKSDNVAMGNVTIRQQPTCSNTNAIIEATGTNGFIFSHWNDGNTENPRTVAVTQDSVLTAFFEKNVTANISSSDNVMGYTSNNTTYFKYGETITVSAIANYGHHFTQWSDGVTDNPRTITLTSDVEFQAQFAVNQYRITLKSNNPAKGSVSGNGTFNYNTTNTITATANPDCLFVCWSDSITDNPRRLKLLKDTTLVASFVNKYNKLQISSNNTAMGSVSGGGSIMYSSQAKITATPASHHHFVSWSDGNCQNPRTLQVVSDTQLVATFAIDSFTVAATSRTEEFGTVNGGGLYAYGTVVEVKAVPNPHYHFTGWSNGVKTISQELVVEQDMAFSAEFAIDSHRLQVASADSAKGTVTGSGNYDYGQQITVSATAAAGCYFTGWSDGTTANPRIITIESDTTVVANFEQMLEFSITVVPSDTARGTVSGSGKYVSGTEATLSATPRQHYLFSQWSDGRTDNPRTIRVIADATYKAVFVPEQYNVVLSQNNADMGMVSGSGVYSYGDMVSCLAKPYQNYHFVQWSNGETANPYEFSISDNQILTAYFAAGAVTAIEDEATAEPIIYAVGKIIIVENATNEILVYDAMGKLVGRAGRDVPWRVSTGTLTITVNVSGVYIVKTGNVVMRVVVE